MEYRIGIGYDIHRLVEGRRLLLGGVEIPYIKGLLGHSDADVLIHAISDALLGAMGEPDIGEHFPDTDPKYLGISSVELLKKVLDILKSKKYRICNIDAVLVAQEPTLVPFKAQIRKKLSEILKIKENCLNVKAKTNEGLGEMGNKEAIACYANALLLKEG
ncbi:MAG: 2-C-methyl-D-erythritol 2,4-cyclodiphosphate synthase [Candidatus Omnitrophota bacterium]|jgi:2-C-methyl-D-erythritol 2,4-cyclodiphosphate synthase